MRSHRLYRSFAAFAFVALAATSCSGGVTGTSTPPPPSDPATETYAASLGVNLASMTKVSNDLYTKDLTVGTGVVALNTHSVTVIYTGYFVNGTQFDSNVGGTPFQFFLGTGEVIPGWDQGMAGMRVGGKRLLVVGSTLGYGSVPHGSIPASSTLVFTVQLTSVQ